MSGRRVSITVGALVAGIVGVVFFNLIVGVFGLTLAWAALAVFIGIAVIIARTPQPEED